MTNKIEIGHTYYTSNGEFITPTSKCGDGSAYWCNITTIDENDKESTRVDFLTPADILR